MTRPDLAAIKARAEHSHHRLIRDLVAYAEHCETQLERLAAGDARVRELHREVPNPWWAEGGQTTPTFGATECAHDYQRWPCKTARARDGEGA